MRFTFDKAACQNIRRALRKEWLLCNRRGDYCSGTVPGCNTRRYHGLLTANLADPPGRHVLLSTLEESVAGGEKEFFFSARKHPGVYYPKGYEHLHRMETGSWPVFRYRVGPLELTREILLLGGRPMVLVRYSANNFPGRSEGMPSLSLRIKPLLAFRPMHALTRANMDLQVTTFPIGNRNPGFLIRPYNALPPLYVRTEGAKGAFYPSPDWCRNVNYLVEEERGFPCEEDLFLPGVLSLELRPGGTVYFAASAGAGEITESLAGLWEEEAEQRACLADAAAPQEHLRLEGTRFLIRPDQEEENGALAPKSGASDIFEPSGVVAGYHWFDVWGRDSLIALPGLTFAAGRAGEGEAVLAAISKAASNGLVPNMFARGSRPAAYNSVDASLWYVWAVQQMLIWAPGRESFVRDVCWPVIRSIVEVYRDNSRQAGPEGAPRLPLWADEEGMLHAGNAETQLTWMDATARGRPVTPRHGCPVEINALWYNAVAFADDLARRYDEPGRRNPDYARMRAVFRSRFWTPRHGGHLGDVWRDGVLDTDVRPNQIFAVAVPYSPLDEDDQPFVVESVRNHLLTPYGLRSLSPRAAAYQGRYEGGPDQRDEAYHQGTVWPWLLGSYAEALLKTAWDIDGAVRALLNTLSPLFSSHLADAGLGSLSEIFDGNPPHAPNGCIAQAWSVAECYRMLRMLEKAAPRVYAEWETLLSGR